MVHLGFVLEVLDFSAVVHMQLTDAVMVTVTYGDNEDHVRGDGEDGATGQQDGKSGGERAVRDQRAETQSGAKEDHERPRLRDA